MTVQARGRTDRPPSALRETFPRRIQSARSLERQSIIADWFGLTAATTEFHNNLAREREWGAPRSQFYTSMKTLIAAYFTPRVARPPITFCPGVSRGQFSLNFSRARTNERANSVRSVSHFDLTASALHAPSRMRANYRPPGVNEQRWREGLDFWEFSFNCCQLVSHT